MHLYKLGRIAMNKRLAALAIFLLLLPLQASPFTSQFISKGLRFTDEVIEYLSKLAREPDGAKKVGKFISKKNLPEKGNEDALLRIAVRNGAISHDEAKGLFSRLSGVKGFTSALRQTIGNKQPNTRGALYELRIADRAKQSGFSIREIRQRFVAGNKKGPTDIDVVMEKNGRTFAVEAKDYPSGASLPMDRFRADMDTLVEYQSRMAPGKCIPVFSITRRPSERHWAMLQHEADKRGIKLIDGSAEAQAKVLNFLARQSSA